MIGQASVLVLVPVSPLGVARGLVHGLALGVVLDAEVLVSVSVWETQVETSVAVQPEALEAMALAVTVTVLPMSRNANRHIVTDIMGLNMDTAIITAEVGVSEVATGIGMTFRPKMWTV
jgi:hypothetical protein